MPTYDTIIYLGNTFDNHLTFSEVIEEAWASDDSDKLLEYMKANYGLLVMPDSDEASSETAFDIENTACLGMSHGGPVYSSSNGAVELSDDEVSKLVALMKEKGTSDIKELDLENIYPEIFEKLDDWLESYIESLDEAEQIDFFKNQMNANVEMNGNDVSYEVRIPEAIIELAKN